MTRAALGLATFLALAGVSLHPAVALACDQAGCPCHHSASAGEPAKAAPQMAEKCKCEGQSDCTCKKGQCKCSKCQLRNHPSQPDRQAGA